MKKEYLAIAIIAVLGAGAYFYFKKEKSFLEMTESEKKANVEEEAKKRIDIQNNSNLTNQQKIEAEEAINKENILKRTKEEAEAIAKYNLDNLMNGVTSIKDASLPSYLKGGIS